ncbi:unnamed protein product [Symbiodinium sp. CCMP2592]|nr:unnamed protein product [Symbiodinium sp. CCMP2592]
MTALCEQEKEWIFKVAEPRLLAFGKAPSLLVSAATSCASPLFNLILRTVKEKLFWWRVVAAVSSWTMAQARAVSDAAQAAAQATEAAQAVMASAHEARRIEALSRFIQEPDMYKPDTREQEIDQWTDWRHVMRNYLGVIDANYLTEMDEVEARTNEEARLNAATHPAGKEEPGALRYPGQLHPEPPLEDPTEHRRQLMREMQPKTPVISAAKAVRPAPHLEIFDISEDTVADFALEPAGPYFVQMVTQAAVDHEGEEDTMIILDSGADASMGNRIDGGTHCKFDFWFVAGDGRRFAVREQCVVGNVQVHLLAIGKLLRRGWQVINDGEVKLQDPFGRAAKVAFRHNSWALRGDIRSVAATPAVRALTEDPRTLPPAPPHIELPAYIQDIVGREGMHELPHGIKGRHATTSRPRHADGVAGPTKGGEVLKRYAEELLRFTIALHDQERIVLQSDAEPTIKAVVRTTGDHKRTDMEEIHGKMAVGSDVRLWAAFGGKPYNGKLCIFGETVYDKMVTPYKGGAQWIAGAWVGPNPANGTHNILTDKGAIMSSLRSLHVLRWHRTKPVAAHPTGVTMLGGRVTATQQVLWAPVAGGQ